MKGREAKASSSSSSSDLFVCFPSHLTLMPKPICSPIRPADSIKRHNNNHNYLKKSSTTKSSGQASPLLWTKNKSMDSESSEPNSPKVTCAGQIKVRPKTIACKSWQSVMEEIEKIHNKKQKKRPNWEHSLSFKKEMTKLLTCLQCTRFKMGCFGTIPEIDVEVEEDEFEDERHQENHVSEREASGTLFSKWFMVLQENQSNGVLKEETEHESKVVTDDGSNVPPRNALLLMRCRSAPVKSSLKEKNEEEEQRERGDAEEKTGVKKGQSLKSLMEENRKKENLLVMRYNSEFCKISSSEISKETWIVGELRDSLSRSGSWIK